jgi:flagellar biosynthesis protein FliR
VNIHFDPVVVTAFALALVRGTAWIFVSPPFNSRTIPTTVKAGLAAALALAVAPHIKDPQLSLDTAPFVGALLSQVLIGLALGMLTQLLVGAISAAGSLVDLFAGYSLAATFDPLSDHQASTFGRLYQLIAATLLFTTNAHLVLVNGFFRSFDAIPASGVTPGAISKLLTDNLGVFTVAAIEVAGPVLACLFLTEITLGLLARAAPSLNVFSLAFPLRVGVALIVVAVALPLIAPALGNLVHASVSPFGG